MPVLGVTYADLYRQTKIEETIYELLTQQYELAKVQEAKEIPSVKVLDIAVVPTKKSFPPRLLIIFLGVFIAELVMIAYLFLRRAWDGTDSQDPRKRFLEEIAENVRADGASLAPEGSFLRRALSRVSLLSASPPKVVDDLRAINQTKRRSYPGPPVIRGDLKEDCFRLRRWNVWRDVSIQGGIGRNMDGAATRQAPDKAGRDSQSATSSFSHSRWPDAGNGDSRDNRARPGGLLRQASYVLIDSLMVGMCGLSVYWARFGTIRDIPHPYNGFLILYAALIFLTCASQNLYRTPREWSAMQESFRVAKAVGFATALLVLFIFTSRSHEISRVVVVCSGAINIITLSGWRYAKRLYVSHRLRQGIGTRRALIIGSGKISQDLASCFDQNHQLGYTFCGFLDFHPNGDPRVIGKIKDFRQIALRSFADEVFITLPTDRDIVKQIFLEAQRLRLHLHIVPGSLRRIWPSCSDPYCCRIPDAFPSRSNPVASRAHCQTSDRVMFPPLAWFSALPSWLLRPSGSELTLPAPFSIPLFASEEKGPSSAAISSAPWLRMPMPKRPHFVR